MHTAHIMTFSIQQYISFRYLPIPKSMMKSFDLSTFMKVKDAVCSDNILRNDVFSDEDVSIHFHCSLWCELRVFNEVK